MTFTVKDCRKENNQKRASLASNTGIIYAQKKNNTFCSTMYDNVKSVFPERKRSKSPCFLPYLPSVVWTYNNY